MKNLLVLTVTFLLTSNIFSQTLKKTYYDPLTKTMILESYYVNSAGQGNGSYKKYWKDGNLTLKGTFKNGSKEGVWTSYSSRTGKLTISQTETYKDDVLNGAAVYFMDGSVIKSKGNYVDGKKDGEWIENTVYVYDDKDGVSKKDYVRSIVFYEKGKHLEIENGEAKEYFYPSKKIRSIVNYKESFKFGKCTWYYPTGAIETEQLFEEKGSLVHSKAYYINGGLKEFLGTKDGKEHYEEYDRLGKPTIKMENWAINREVKLKEGKLLHKGDSCFFAHKLEEAKEYFLQSGKASYNGYSNPSPVGYQKKNIIQCYQKGEERWKSYKRIDLFLEEFTSLNRFKFKSFDPRFISLIDESIDKVINESIKLNPEKTLDEISKPKYSKILPEEYVSYYKDYIGKIINEKKGN